MKCLNIVYLTIYYIDIFWLVNLYETQNRNFSVYSPRRGDYPETFRTFSEDSQRLSG